jgi:hypothetical protein
LVGADLASRGRARAVQGCRARPGRGGAGMLGEAAGVGDDVRGAGDAAVDAGGLAYHRRRARDRWSQGVETGSRRLGSPLRVAHKRRSWLGSSSYKRSRRVRQVADVVQAAKVSRPSLARGAAAMAGVTGSAPERSASPRRWWRKWGGAAACRLRRGR